MLSDSSTCAGVTVHIIAVWLFPPRAFWSILVNLESRNDTCWWLQQPQKTAFTRWLILHVDTFCHIAKRKLCMTQHLLDGWFYSCQHILSNCKNKVMHDTVVMLVDILGETLKLAHFCSCLHYLKNCTKGQNHFTINNKNSHNIFFIIIDS